MPPSTRARAAISMLPPNHPQTIRVRRIAAHLIATACDYDDDDKSRFGLGARRSLLERIRRCPVNGGVDWRVDVVEDGVLEAYSHCNGIVRVSTGFLRYMRTDADVAAVLGHEVAHVMARHSLQERRNSFWAGFLVNFAAELLNVPRDRFTEDKWEFIFLRPCYFRQEFEADHLGLLLLAAAGYDPRNAPKAYEKLRDREMVGGGEDDDHAVWSTHPTCTERIRRLSQAKVMDEALDLYRQALRSGTGKHTQASRFLVIYLHVRALLGSILGTRMVAGSSDSLKPRQEFVLPSTTSAPEPCTTSGAGSAGKLDAAGSLSVQNKADLLSIQHRLCTRLLANAE